MPTAKNIALFPALLMLVFVSSAVAVLPDKQEKSEPAVTNAVEPQASVTAEVESLEQVKAAKPEFKVSWTNQLKYSNMFRVQKPDARLWDPTINSQNYTTSDGEHSFPHRGMVSNRADVLSELDVAYGEFGIRFSAAGWLDTMYNRRLHPNSAGGPQSGAVASPSNWDGAHYSRTDDFQQIQFRNIELLDAFVHAKFKLPGGRALNIRAGQFAQVWGQTLFYGSNGIAGGMVPVDIAKAQAVPNSTTKEVMRPVPQVSVQVDLNAKVALSAYYQFLWAADRFPAVGSYFDNGSVVMPGAERFPLDQSGLPGMAWYRDKSMLGRNGGQFGAQLLIQGPWQTDIGLHAIRYTDKAFEGNSCFTPIIGAEFGLSGGCATNQMRPEFASLADFAGTYWVDYHKNINAFAVSASKSIGLTNYAMEISAHTHQNLFGGSPVLQTVANSTSGHAVGDTVGINISTMTVPKPNKFCKETSVTTEFAYNNLVSVSSNVGNLNYGYRAPKAGGGFTPIKRQSFGFTGIYGMTYRQVMQGVDLMPQVSLSFNPLGKGAGGSFGPERGGNLSLTLGASYKDAWRGSLNYNHYYGPTNGNLITGPGGIPYATAAQALHDRDFISFSIYRSIGAAYSPKSK